MKIKLSACLFFALCINIVFSAIASGYNYTIAVNVNPADSGTVYPSSGTYADQSIVELYATPKAKYKFDYWSVGISTNSNPCKVLIDSNKSFTANFSRTAYSISSTIYPFDSAGQITLNPPGGTYTIGTQVTLTAEPTEDYVFYQWVYSGHTGPVSWTDNPVTIIIDTSTANNDINISVEFEKKDKPPEISNINISDGSIISDDKVYLKIDAVDDVAVTKVIFYIDNKEVISFKQKPFEWTWDTRSYSDGPHSIKYIAADTAGQTSEKSISLTIKKSLNPYRETIDIKPNITFSPNGDGIRDILDLGSLGNFNEIKIMNLNGSVVKIIAGNEKTWNGRDDNNNMLPVGAYIYAAKMPDGKISSGTVIIAR